MLLSLVCWPQGDNKRDYSLVLSLLALLLMLVIFYAFHYGVGLMYLRGLLFMMLMMSVVIGAGLMGGEKTQAGKKIVPVSPHKRAAPGEVKKTVAVKPHRSSTPE